VSALQSYYQVTLDLIRLLQNETDRDKKIQQTDELLNQREVLMNSIKPPYNDSENEMGAQLLKLEPVLSQLLKKEKLEIQKDLKELSKKKESTNKYTNPYASVQTDGMFYDKRN